MKLSEIEGVIDSLHCGPGDGWRYEIQILQAFYDHMKDQLVFQDGDRVVLIKGFDDIGTNHGYHFWKDDVKTGSVGRVEDIDWSRKSKCWGANFIPDSKANTLFWVRLDRLGPLVLKPAVTTISTNWYGDYLKSL